MSTKQGSMEDFERGTGDESEEEADPQPACETSLNAGDWEAKEAAVFPPGYPRLCTAEECFGDLVPEEAWHEDHTADWDHTEHVDVFVRSSSSGHKRRGHRRRRK